MKYIIFIILCSLQATVYGSQSSELTTAISDHSVLFDDADLVAIVEFGPHPSTFTIKEVIFPIDSSGLSEMLDYDSGVWTGVYSRASYPESEDQRSPIIFNQVPYLVFFKVLVSASEREKQIVFQPVHGRHGCLPLIDLDRLLEFEGVRDYYSRKWHAYANGNSHYNYTPGQLVESALMSVMIDDYGTIDGTIINEAILGVRDLYSAKNASSRMEIIHNEQLWGNPVFRKFVVSVIRDVSLKDHK